MSDEDTKLKINEATKTSLELKIQVRLLSGKIFGPYRREEIFQFIENRKLQGEETILYEGSTQWLPLVGDPEFYDALQKKNSNASTKKRKASGNTQVTQVSEDQKNPSEIEGVVAQPMDAKPIFQAPLEVQTSTRHAISPTSPVLGGGPASASTVASAPLTPQKNSKKLLWVTLLTFVVAATGAYLFLPRNSGPQPLPSKIAIKSPFNYSHSLQGYIHSWTPTFPALPATLQSSEYWGIAVRPGVPVWIEDLKNLEVVSEGQEKNTAAYWGRRAWDLIWIGYTLKVFDARLGEAILGRGLEIYRGLESKKLVSLKYKALFDSISLINEGLWEQVIEKLNAFSKDPEVAAVIEDASWFLFWESGAKDKNIVHLAPIQEENSPALEAVSRARSAYLSQDSELFKKVEELATSSPLSVDLWLLLGQHLTAVKGAQNPQAPYAAFLTGAAVLSLYPASYQRTFWAVMAEFFSRFGRQDSFQQANANLKILLSKNMLNIQEGKENPLWWDLGSAGLLPSMVTNDILLRSEQGVLTQIDLAALMAISSFEKQGSKAMQVVGESFALEGKWTEALQYFKKCTEIDSKNVACWGGQSWAYSNLFQFDKALDSNDRVAQSSSELPEAQKYMGMIHFLAREIETSIKELKEYTAKVPQDGWGHYFLGQVYVSQEKNVDCVKAARLAVMNGHGLLSFRGKILLLKCQILAGLAVQQSLSEFRDMLSKDSHNVPLWKEYIDAQAKAGFLEPAVQSAEEGIRKNPNAFDLRVEIADLYALKENQDQALAYYNRALKDQPNSAEVYVKIAKLFEDQDRFKEALQNYDTAARLQPEFPEAWLKAAHMAKKLKLEKDTTRYYLQELDARPNLSVFIELSEYLLEIRAPQEVPAVFQKYQKSFQDDPRVLTRLAQAYLAMDDPENARIYAETALSQDKNLAEAHRVLGYAYDKQGQLEMAAPHLKRYLEILPQAADANEVRGRLQEIGR